MFVRRAGEWKEDALFARFFRSLRSFRPDLSFFFAVELVAVEMGTELGVVGSSSHRIAEVHTKTFAAAGEDDSDMMRKIAEVERAVLAAAVEACSHPLEVLDLYNSLPYRCQYSQVQVQMRYWDTCYCVASQPASIDLMRNMHWPFALPTSGRSISQPSPTSNVDLTEYRACSSSRRTFSLAAVLFASVL